MLTSGGDGSSPTWVDASTVGTTDHGALTGLSDDDHTAIRPSCGKKWRTISYWWNNSGDNLTLNSTTDATKGLLT